MKKWQKALTMALAGAGCFMTYAPVNVQAADKAIIQQADKQGLQKVTAITQVYGDGEKVAVAILEYPQDINPNAVNVTDFSATGKEMAKVYVNNQPQTANTSRLGRYIVFWSLPTKTVPTTSPWVSRGKAQNHPCKGTTAKQAMMPLAAPIESSPT